MNNIYVDELSKRCDECKFQIFVAYHKNGWEHKERFCSVMKNNYDCICSKEKCPLKLLTDRLAEERKKVVREIWQEFEQRLKAKTKDMSIIQVCLMINSVLDQIERGDKYKN